MRGDDTFQARTRANPAAWAGRGAAFSASLLSVLLPLGRVGLILLCSTTQLRPVGSLWVSALQLLAAAVASECGLCLPRAANILFRVHLLQFYLHNHLSFILYYHREDVEDSQEPTYRVVRFEVIPQSIKLEGERPLGRGEQGPWGLPCSGAKS